MPAIVTQLSIDKLLVSDSPTVARSSADQRQIFSIGQQIMSKATLRRYARDCHPTVDRQVDALFRIRVKKEYVVPLTHFPEPSKMGLVEARSKWLKYFG